MLSKRIIPIIILCVSILCGCTNSKSLTQAPVAENQFSFSVLKIGQADAIILHTANHSAIIDCGEEDDGKEIVKDLEKQNIANVDYLFITHFDKDHVGGVSEVLKNITVKNIVTPDYEGTNSEYESYIKTAEQKNISPIRLTENMSFTLDDVLFEVFPPQMETYEKSDNDFSLAIGITHGENSFLFTGDAEAERLTEIIAQTNRQYDFLKVPHHGRHNKKTKAFIEAIKPTYAVITCSKKNPAEEETISLLENANCKTYLTADGDITVTSDGKEIKITQ